MKVVAHLPSSARWLLLRAALTSGSSGVGAALLVALINEALAAPRAALPALGWRFGALSVIVLVLRWISQRQFVRLNQASLARLRARVGRAIAEAPYRSVEARGQAPLMAVLTEDVSAVAQFFATLPDLLMNGAIVLGCLAYLGVLSWPVLAFALAMVALGSLGYHLADARALRHLRASRSEEDRLFAHFHALFAGAKELKLNAQRRREFLDQQLDASIDRAGAERTRGLLLYVVSASWGSFLFFALIGTVLFVFGPAFDLSQRALSGYALMFLYMMLPLDMTLGAIPGINRARVALQRIDELLGALAPATQTAPAPPTEPRFERLVLRKVTHSYRREADDGVFALGPIDFELRRGELVFIVGGNGSGKTTLAKLLVGLYPQESGELLLNGTLVGEAEAEHYRQHFSAVFSDFFLFDRLLGLGARGGLDAQARTLLAQLHLDHKVDVLQGTFSTTQLSAGQRKRLALVVAYLEDRPIYLFDEWAADQDPTYKEVFYATLLPGLKARGKAVVVVTHDDRYFHLADRCIRIEEGRMVAWSVGDAWAHEPQQQEPRALTG